MIFIQVDVRWKALPLSKSILEGFVYDKTTQIGTQGIVYAARKCLLLPPRTDLWNAAFYNDLAHRWRNEYTALDWRFVAMAKSYQLNPDEREVLNTAKEMINYL